MRLRAATILLLLVVFSSPGHSGAAEVVINAVGDVMLAGRWAPVIRARGYDYPFRGVAAELKAGDVTIANLESPVATGGREYREKQFRFRAEPAVAAALKQSGIGMVTLANNHSMDFGEDALRETMLHLDRAGIDKIGAGMNLDEARQLKLLDIKGRKVAFLGYSLTRPVEFFAGRERGGTAPGYDRYYREDIRAARRLADYVIVSFHWGTEGKSEVQPYQRDIARKAIDAGADVIIGHHPHVLRGIERYNGGIIFYSLGNFVFASKSRLADAGVIVRLRLDGTRREAELLPVDILHRRVGFQPRRAERMQAEQIIDRISALSRPLGTGVARHGDRYLIDFSHGVGQ